MAIIGGIYTTGESSVDKPSGTGITLTVGHARIASVVYADGGVIEAALTGDAWDDLIDINLGVPFEFSIVGPENSFEHAIWLKVGFGETNGDYIRIQVEVDGVAIIDFTNTSDNVSNIENKWYPLSSGGVYNHMSASHQMYANSRFRIRAWKNGTFDDANSLLRIGAVHYNKITV